MSPEPGNHTTDEDEGEDDGSDERPSEALHDKPSAAELRGSIRQEIGREPKPTNLRKMEIAAVYERLAGKHFPDDATVPEGRHRVVDVLAGVENRDQFSAAYPFRRHELEAILAQLREAGIDDEAAQDPDPDPDNGGDSNE